MALKIVRNDITRMKTEAVVNTASQFIAVGPGCDCAIYKAAGHDVLLNYRKEHIGEVPEGEVFLTPGFDLAASYIIHAVSPIYWNGSPDAEEKLRSCYRKSLALAEKHAIRSIAFPLIATGSFGYPKEEGMRIAVDEINAFLLRHDMLVYLVVFGSEAVALGKRIDPDLESYIDRHYVEEKHAEEYDDACFEVSLNAMPAPSAPMEALQAPFDAHEVPFDASEAPFGASAMPHLEERIQHLSDTFSEYLLYLIAEHGMENAEVWKRAIVDKKTFSKLKNNPDYHPTKLTALCLCIGAKLSLDETRDLLARAGYALSPCDKTDIIFSYFIEHEIYDMIELDIQLEEHDLPCIIN